MTDHARAEWTWLTEVANDKNNPDWQYLVEFRNTLSFHYHTPKRLTAGYDLHFFQDPKREDNTHAFVSVVHNHFRQGRFYFADAAAQRAMQRLGDEQRLADLAMRVGYAAYAMVQAFLLVKHSRLK